jgi:predicted phosphodiesterase
MRTLIISDLHLGSTSHSDLLRRGELREPLLRALADVDRVVLLGDVLELRHGPPRAALAVARPLFEELGRALDGRELVLVAGNHDHALIEPWLAQRAELSDAPELGLEQLIDAADVSPTVARLAEWAAPARTRYAYPGLWLRADVYATHGHYLDCHLTVPTIERLSVGVMSRLLGRPAQSFESVADYEAVTAPMYAWRYAVARSAQTGNALNGIATVDAWRALGGGRDTNKTRRNGASRRRLADLKVTLRRGALVGGFPIAVEALNRLGLGPLRSKVSLGELRSAGLRAMGEVSQRLGLVDCYVVFGHTHRAGPLAADNAAEWIARPPRGDGAASPARLINAGCWTYDEIFLTGTPGESPYWPGTCVILEDSGPPVLRHLLLDRSSEQLSRTGAV